MNKNIIYGGVLIIFSNILCGCGSSNTPPLNAPQTEVQVPQKMCSKANGALETLHHSQSEFEKGVFYVFYCK